MRFLGLHVLIPLLLALPLAAAVQPGVVIPSDGSFPILNLPYASYRATNYSAASDIYTFQNIRFAAPPVGNLRWAKPVPPLNESTLQDGSYGPKCIQTAQTSVNLLGPGNQNAVGGALNQFLGGIPVPLFAGGQEDCLFLDIYVPGKALKDPSMKLPVAAFIYGGAFLFGSKDAFRPDFPYYDGSGLIENSGNNMIFMAMNYRLGGFGFLAGTTMEREASPNAGLWDQRAAFQWVKDYIHLVGGDPNSVTAIGQSAGAGSIMHHLVAEGGTLDPLFSRAVMQSAAYQWMWDRNGLLQDMFDGFASHAGCKGEGIACLRNASVDALSKANDALSGQVASGSFAVGPSTDGSYIRQMPVLELLTGNYWSIESVVVSHAFDETSLFVNGGVSTDDKFTTFVRSIFPRYMDNLGLNKLILSFYPPVGTGDGTYQSESGRFEAFLRDACFTCHGRHLTETIKKDGTSRVWNMQYSVSPGLHSSDLLPTFYNQAFTSSTLVGQLTALFSPITAAVIGGISTGYQSYLTSLITTGDPNKKRSTASSPATIQWDQPDTNGEMVSGVLDVGNSGYSIINDNKNVKSSCDFWREMAAAVTSGGGYAPPGSTVHQSLINITGDPSAHYVGGNGNAGSSPSGGHHPQKSGAGASAQGSVLSVVATAGILLSLLISG